MKDEAGHEEADGRANHAASFALGWFDGKEFEFVEDTVGGGHEEHEKGHEETPARHGEFVLEFSFEEHVSRGGYRIKVPVKVFRVGGRSDHDRVDG